MFGMAPKISLTKSVRNNTGRNEGRQVLYREDLAAALRGGILTDTFVMDPLHLDGHPGGPVWWWR